MIELFGTVRRKPSGHFDPNNLTLIDGDTNLGLYGIYPDAELGLRETISGIVNVTEGTYLEPRDSDWWCYAFKGKVLLTPANGIRNAIGSAHLASRNVINGSLIVTLYGRDWRVRLMEGSIADPAPTTRPNPDTSEWFQITRKMLIASDGGTGEWGEKTEFELGIRDYTPWCRERDSTGVHLLRGGNATGLHPLEVYLFRASGTQTYRAWRPVLELID